jgi:uncharacterized protein YjiS (DUF1127 family)
MKRPYLKGVESSRSKEGKMHNTVTAWIARHRYRRDLVRQLELGNHLIKDIGLTLEQALSEIGKPFWRA